MPSNERAQTRPQKRVSLEEIAQATKISPIFLEAIVREDFDKLPGGIFDRSYIRQYAVAAGVDENEILRRYQDHQSAKQLQEANSALQPRRTSSLRSLVERMMSA